MMKMMALMMTILWWGSDDNDNFTMMIINYLKHLEWFFESSLSSFYHEWDYFTHDFKIYDNIFH